MGQICCKGKSQRAIRPVVALAGAAATIKANQPDRAEGMLLSQGAVPVLSYVQPEPLPPGSSGVLLAATRPDEPNRQRERYARQPRERRKLSKPRRTKTVTLDDTQSILPGPCQQREERPRLQPQPQPQPQQRTLRVQELIDLVAGKLHLPRSDIDADESLQPEEAHVRTQARTRAQTQSPVQPSRQYSYNGFSSGGYGGGGGGGGGGDVGGVGSRTRSKAGEVELLAPTPRRPITVHFPFIGTSSHDSSHTHAPSSSADSGPPPQRPSSASTIIAQRAEGGGGRGGEEEGAGDRNRPRTADGQTDNAAIPSRSPSVYYQAMSSPAPAGAHASDAVQSDPSGDHGFLNAVIVAATAVASLPQTWSVASSEDLSSSRKRERDPMTDNGNMPKAETLDQTEPAYSTSQSVVGKGSKEQTETTAVIPLPFGPLPPPPPKEGEAAAVTGRYRK
ncbi:hypothetical protein SPI_06902 [Niveomyces insectorum RCEF 264]|uniref:Uncharacterized protein n=1 Tax=Niveomyces insectorum RCEF 264 TaxID=1081102 RepID=A0A167QVV6_9HYPO|nr:hypothetical protein SPI_06902 [Niveomyces insectorum RCEF 264]